jgi:hypothetical protein
MMIFLGFEGRAGTQSLSVPQSIYLRLTLILIFGMKAAKSS